MGVARWRGKPKNFKTVRGKGKNKGYWVKPGGSGAAAPPASNPYAGAPKWAQDYLGSLDQAPKTHMADIDQNVAPWLKSAVDSQTALATGLTAQNNALMANIQGSVGNALGTGLGPSLSGTVYTGPSGQQKANAAANAALTSLGTAQHANTGVANALGVADYGKGIINNLATYRAGLPKLYEDQNAERKARVLETVWNFKNEHKRWGTEMRMRAKEREMEGRLRQAEIAAQAGQFGAEMDFDYAKLNEESRQFDASLAHEKEVAAEKKVAKAAKGKKKDNSPATRHRRKAVDFVKELKKKNWRDVTGQVGKKNVTERVTLPQIVNAIMDQSDGYLDRAWVEKMVKAYGAKPFWPDIPTVG